MNVKNRLRTTVKSVVLLGMVGLLSAFGGIRFITALNIHQYAFG